MKATGVIPARWASTRFPGKPLAKILGKTMLQRVWEQASKAKTLDKIIIATDDLRIADEAAGFGAEVRLTGKAASGTDRIRALARGLNCEIVVNVQGDEPLINPSHIDKLVKAFKDRSVGMATLATDISEKEYLSPHCVKVLSDKSGRALYFSRAPIPYGSSKPAKKHIGIYAYRKKILLASAKFKSHLAGAEDLEQLSFLENGIAIKVIAVKYRGIAVDTPSDIKKVTGRLRS
ncbi:MAG: 3-deoxy-manno-octulosonate cytidylyltransferase [Elusimicrobia bacterium CG_4_10_14_3_um_filter_49_12_50_7]|nr:MAG: 3-deoxy-manno-octulosonate cytidylyltransferase [Elusimicrobia bacterium CG03_land_8_20_14_0_80_50_18]PIX14016.1 MAG: 3-deoxy-manno-octulosonate cytidylyltransferase [Elusimicrobia bacterium CG_4_8_14_3_um_filter_50_9]PIY15420.1 MAG: 3-deoxy-manno-octulosonate cytidylyltransferase [Elusimicrobia bacterium CG_4_10_14_3_um_filter_49_12_50_7]